MSASDSQRSSAPAMDAANSKSSNVPPTVAAKADGMKMVWEDAWEKLRIKMQRIFGDHETLREDQSVSGDDRNHANDMASNSRSLHTDYTELMGGSVPCPSCKGTGRIPKELLLDSITCHYWLIIQNESYQVKGPWSSLVESVSFNLNNSVVNITVACSQKKMEETLVALIPLNDDRLKPKRTWFWVLIGIAVCAILASGAIFMLVPRSVDLYSSRPAINIIHVTEHKQLPPTIRFHFMNYVNISNANYYVVQVVNTSATIISKFQPWSSDVIGSGLNSTTTAIAPLSSRNNLLMFNNSVTLTDVVAEYCQAPFSRLTSLYVNMQFDIVVSLVYFNHREQVSLSTTQQVCCVPSGNCTST